MIEQVEIVKGPASSLYGSEAVGGLINIITRHPDHAPTFFADLNQTSWGELNVDVGTSYSLGDKARGLLGINTYYYNIPIDNNQDNFTDVTLQKRVSLFNKWSFVRHKNRLMNLAARVFYEDRGEEKCNGKRSIEEVVKFMGKVYIQQDMNYWAIINYLLRASGYSVFPIPIMTKTLSMEMLSILQSNKLVWTTYFGCQLGKTRSFNGTGFALSILQ